MRDDQRRKTIEIKVWPNDKKFWSYGKTVMMPLNYFRMLLGNRIKTTYVKSHSQTVYIEMKRGFNFSRAVAIWAPKEVIQAAEELSANKPMGA